RRPTVVGDALLRRGVPLIGLDHVIPSRDRAGTRTRGRGSLRSRQSHRGQSRRESNRKGGGKGTRPEKTSPEKTSHPVVILSKIRRSMKRALYSESLVKLPRRRPKLNQSSNRFAADSVEGAPGTAGHDFWRACRHRGAPVIRKTK